MEEVCGRSVPDIPYQNSVNLLIESQKMAGEFSNTIKSRQDADKTILCV